MASLSIRLRDQAGQVVLGLLALVTLGFKTFLEWRQHREYELAQQASLSESGDTTLLMKSKSE